MGGVAGGSPPACHFGTPPVAGYSQRMRTFTRGHLVGSQSTSTRRQLLSGASRRRLLLLIAMNLPHALGTVTSYLGTALWASAGAGERRSSAPDASSHGLAAIATSAIAITTSTTFTKRSATIMG